MYEWFFCCIVFYGKSWEIFAKFNKRKFKTVTNVSKHVYCGKQLLRMNPSNAPPQACMFIFHSLWKISFGRCVCVCSTKTLCFHGIQESAHLVFFTWLLLYSICDWFSGTLFTRVMHSPFFSFLIKTAAMYGLLILFWLLYSIFGSSWRFKAPGPDLPNRLISPIIIFTFQLPSLELLSAIFTVLSLHTCDVSGHMIKFEAFMADDSWSCNYNSILSQKSHKEAF